MCSIPHGWSYSSLGALTLPSWLLLHCGSPGEPNHCWDSSCTTSCFMKSRNFLHVSEPLRLLVSFSQSSFPCDKACKRIFYKSAILHPSFSRIGPIAFKGNSFFFYFAVNTLAIFLTHPNSTSLSFPFTSHQKEVLFLENFLLYRWKSCSSDYSTI